MKALRPRWLTLLAPAALIVGMIASCSSGGDTGAASASSGSSTVAVGGGLASSSASGSGGQSSSSGSAGGAAPAVDVIPTNRRIDWSAAGVPGGIPSTMTVCGTLDPKYGDGVTDAADALQSLIDQCASSKAAPQVVLIPAGKYVLSHQITFGGKSYLTVRGAGADQTTLLPAGNAFYVGGDDAAPLGVTVTLATKGATSLTVSSAAGVAVGDILKIDRDDDPALVFTTKGPGRNISQMILVTAITGNTIAFEPALIWDFTLNPLLANYVLKYRNRYLGLEDMKIDHSGGGAGASFQFFNCYACWVKGIYSYKPSGYHSIFAENLSCEVRDSFFNDSQAYGADNAGMALYGTNTAWKIENNIFYKNFPGVECQLSTSGNYIGYNYGYQAEAGWDYSATMWSDNHGAHDMMNLWEGNVGEMLSSDGYFGSASHGTLFRNHFSTEFTSKMGNSKSISLERWAYDYNIVGNVLGGASYTPDYYQVTMDNYSYDQSTIYRLGYPNLGNNSLTSYDGKSPPGIDAMVAATLLRWGNYDFFHKAAVWDPKELPPGVPVPASQTLPASLYYPAKPSWWPSAKAWPPIGPDVAGLTNKIPAQDCFESSKLMTGGAFNAHQCYGD